MAGENWSDKLEAGAREVRPPLPEQVTRTWPARAAIVCAFPAEAKALLKHVVSSRRVEFGTFSGFQIRTRSGGEVLVIGAGRAGWQAAFAATMQVRYHCPELEKLLFWGRAWTFEQSAEVFVEATEFVLGNVPSVVLDVEQAPEPHPLLVRGGPDEGRSEVATIAPMPGAREGKAASNGALLVSLAHDPDTPLAAEWLRRRLPANSLLDLGAAGFMDAARSDALPRQFNGTPSRPEPRIAAFVDRALAPWPLSAAIPSGDRSELKSYARRLEEAGGRLGRLLEEWF